MFFIGISIAAFITLFVLLGYKKEQVETEDRWGSKQTKTQVVWKINPRQGLAVFAFILIIPACITKVPANNVAVVYSPFNGTSETTLSEGFHLKNPLDTVYKISTEVQTAVVTGMTSQTKDSQFVTSQLDIKYRVSEPNAYLVFKQFRTLNKMSDALIIPTTQRVLELVTIKYNVMDILGEKRGDIYKELEIALRDELAKYGVEYYSVTLTDVDAGAEIENAITAEAVAKKAVETAEQELLKAQTEAKQKSVIALADQEAAKIKAETKLIEARAEKEANELLNVSLTDLILRQQWIERWNGEVPTYYGGEGSDLIFNTGE